MSVQVLPIVDWLPHYQRRDLRSDLAAGLTVGAMLVPQAMAYALLAGLPPEVGLYASTIPVLVYALFGTSRQLAVGPVAIVSLMTATALAPLVEEGTASYLEAAALLALLVGLVHLVVGIARLGFVVNWLSHSVLVGFTSAAAIIIGFSQVKHLFGITTERQEHFYETVGEVGSNLGGTNWWTVGLAAAAIATMLILKKFVPRAPGALVVVVASIVAVKAFGLEDKGVAVVGNVPDSLPTFGLPTFDGSLIGSLIPTALVITLVGFMESIAVAKVYARRNRYDVDPNQELVSLGMANTASGLFGGYPVTGGFSRTAVNATAGARTPLASIVTAGLVLASIALLTPLFSSLPKAALGAIIIVAVAGLVDVDEIRHIITVKRSDMVGLGVAFFGTLILGIELGIAVAVIASILVVFVRMSRPHTAVLGEVPDTTSFRNVERFPEVVVQPGIRVIRVDAAVSFVNAANVKQRLLAEGGLVSDQEPRVLILDASGINDIDVTGSEMLDEVIDDLTDLGVDIHLSDAKGPVRDVLHRAGIWDRLGSNVHASVFEAVDAVKSQGEGPMDQREAGIDERRQDGGHNGVAPDDGVTNPPAQLSHTGSHTGEKQ